jgi:2-keto-3-deoxy-L-rhamnonate aldolase RhmA
MGKRADWSQGLPRPLVIPTVMTLETLADVRKLMRHLPEDRRGRSTWRYVADQLAEAAHGADPADAAISLHLALMLEGLECRPR